MNIMNQKIINILIDPQIFNEQKFGGISRYYTEIYARLKSSQRVQISCPLLYTENIHFKESPLFETSFQKQNAFLIKYSRIFRPFLPRKLRKKNAQNFISLLKAQEFDLFIPTYYNTEFLKYLGNKPFVLTVYDMIHERFPQYFPEDKDTVPNKKLLMELATKIVAISESTKADILDIYPHLDANKIEVIYLAHAIKPAAGIKFDLPKKYILFIGNRSLYKNFIFFLKAMSPILKADPELCLLCAGGNAFTEEELALITDLDITGHILQRNFDDAELSGYYEHAECFVFPSEYEGFGIPVLEAMACGCPVVLAHHSSFPEVAGDAGIYFELNNTEDLRNKVSHLLENSDVRDKFKQKGLAQASKFNWQKTADACLRIYKESI
jgi:glycosyltransferase involved in cell wall biosynthesis